jgi:phosphotransferase system IIB component
MSTDDELAHRLLEHAGGQNNIRDVDMCFTRLRLVLADPDAVDVAAIEALPEVTMTFTQAGQFQIVLGSRVRRVHSALRTLVAGEVGPGDPAGTAR